MRAPTTARERVQAAKDFVVYYGAGQETELGQYDIAIVEPSGHCPKAVQVLKASGTLVIAYLSVMELASWAEELEWLDDEDFLHVDGQRVLHPQFGNFVLDLRSDRWQGLLMHKAGCLLQRDGYDGLFLDTIGDVEDGRWSQTDRFGLVHRAHQLVTALRASYPQSVLIQNNGLEYLAQYTAPHLDALCWENPPISDYASQDWLRNMGCYLHTLSWENDIRLLALFDGCPHAFTAESDEMTWFEVMRSRNVLISQAAKDYLSVPRKNG